MSIVVKHGAFGEMVPHRCNAASKDGGQLVTTPSCSPRMANICAPSGFGWFGSGCWTKHMWTREVLEEICSYYYGDISTLLKEGRRLILKV